MQKKRIRGVMIAVISVLLVTMTTSGCALVSVNPDKDKQQVIAEIDGQPIYKEEFNNYEAYYDIYYTANGNNMPTGTKLTEFKKDILDNLVQVDAMTAQAKKDKLTINEAEAQKQAETMVESIKKEAGSKYESILAKYNTNNDSFVSFMKTFTVNNAYANECNTKHMDYLKAHPEAELDQVVGKVGGEDVKRGTYNYYYINEEMTAYSTTGKGMQTDKETQKITNTTIFNTIAENKALIKYCTENKIEIPKADIDAALKTKQSTIKMMMQTDEMLNQYLENYFLTKEKFEEYQKEDAKGMAAGQAIQAKLVEEAKVSDSDLQKYFNENKDSYSEAKVSAEHILTEDEALSKEIYEKAKDAKTKEDFEKVMNAYKSNGKVKEATDLGSFNKAKMVKEFSDTAFGMEKNTVSKPVKTQFGYHVIFVYDKNEGQVPSINDKKDEITKIVKDQKGQEEYSKLKEKRVKKEKIEIYDIKSPVENYMNQLKSELNIKVYDKKIK
ncbi:MAG: SurA N-terminal domain-containing protein [Eubacterium sp.]